MDRQEGENRMKAYVDVSEIANTLIKFLSSEEYDRTINSLNGKTMEDGFKNAMFVVPMIILTNCDVLYLKENEDDIILTEEKRAEKIVEALNEEDNKEEVK